MILSNQIIKKEKKITLFNLNEHAKYARHVIRPGWANEKKEKKTNQTPISNK